MRVFQRLAEEGKPQRKEEPHKKDGQSHCDVREEGSGNTAGRANGPDLGKVTGNLFRARKPDCRVMRGSTQSEEVERVQTIKLG